MLHPPPPTSTLFPYTTLFRSASPAASMSATMRADASRSGQRTGEASMASTVTAFESTPSKPISTVPIDCVNERRSEEHTSELQSRRDLVCRLLLEKKKHIV